ncbi:MAG: septum formation initiator family protein [Chromatiales bacterium]|jgi:cell division protein FtsB
MSGVRWLLAALAILFIYLQIRLWVGEGSLAEVTTLKHEISQQKAEIEKLTERNASLEAEVSSLKKDLDAVEERARSDLGMIREGEVYYQIMEPAK